MKKILILNLFPTVYPPTSGGTLRYFHLYNELSQYYDITLLSQTRRKKWETVEFSSTFKEYRVEKDPLYKRLPKDHAKYELALIQNVNLSEHPTRYKEYFDDLYGTADMIIHESPYLLGYDRFLGLDHKPRIYNSHNHEYVLANQIWKNQNARNFLPTIYKLEKQLVEYADLVFATSEQERDSFMTMYNIDSGKIKLAPNGIHPKEWITSKKKSNDKVTALFIGADYPPNIEAARFIIRQLADQCPEVEFILAGGCCNAFHDQEKSNVKLLGRIGHKKKLKLFANVDIAINPMFTGAGVNLKTLEFLSAGIPLFSTNFGTRGLNLRDREEFIRAEKEDFAAKINELCKDQIYLNELASRGQKYINDHYSWKEIARSMKEIIDGALSF